MAKPNTVTLEIAREIARRWYIGTDQVEIARDMNLNKTTVNKHLRRLFGVQTPKHWAGAGRMAIQRPPQEATPTPKRKFIYPNNPPRLRKPHEITPGEAIRFWNKVAAPDIQGCRRWLASFTSDHGQFGSYINGKIKNDIAYRVAWRLTYGPIPEGFQINHRCDVRACVEPTHLWLGTQAQNLADMAAKGRSRAGRGDGQKGEDNTRAKLTWKAVREIRRIRAERGLPLYEIARRFKISPAQVCNIVNNRQWVETSP